MESHIWRRRATKLRTPVRRGVYAGPGNSASTLTAKLRASYGRSTRPPAANLKVAQTAAQADFSERIPDYGNYDVYLANPALGPEHQQGGEGGLDVYFGARAALVITRYNQTVDGLIDAPLVDSVRSLAPNPSLASSIDANGYGYISQYQYLNIGSIRNQGWELQGNINTGPITTRGTYSWTKSRTIGVTPKYRAFFAGIPTYQVGASFKYLPEHTWVVGVTYAHAQTTVALNVSGIGPLLTSQDILFLQHLTSNIRLLQNRLRMTTLGYTSLNRGYASADLMATRRFSSWLEGTIQVQNLTNRYGNDANASNAVLGRQAQGGFRVQFR